MEQGRENYHRALATHRLDEAMGAAWAIVGAGDAYAQETRIWEGEKEDEIGDLVALLASVADLLVPVVPETAEKIKTAIRQNRKPEPLFARKYTQTQ